MFSIGDDEIDVDLDDEEFLLAACGIPSAKPTSLVSTATSTLNYAKTTNRLAQNAHNPLSESCFPSRTNNGNALENTSPTISSHFDNNTIKLNTNAQELLFRNSNLKSKDNTNIHCESGPPSKKVALNQKDSWGRHSSLCCPGPSRSVNPNRHIDKNNHFSNGFITPKTPLNSDRQNSSFSSLSSAELQTPDREHRKQAKKSSPNSEELSSLISNNDVTPSRKKSARKFPGPAGLLPKLSSGQCLDELSINMSPIPSCSTRKSPVNQPLSSPKSQLPSEDEDFSREPWIGMFNEYKQNIPALKRYTIVQVISEAANKKLKFGKVPSLCVLVKTSSPTESDSSIFLKDPTGEIHGTLHKKILEEYPSELGPGAGIILKQVSVFSPSPRKHYLNITPGNIIHIYPPDQNYVSSSQPLASQPTQPSQASQQLQVQNNSPQQRTPIDVVPEIRASANEVISIENMQEPNIDDLLDGLDDEILDCDLLDI